MMIQDIREEASVRKLVFNPTSRQCLEQSKSRLRMWRGTWFSISRVCAGPFLLAAIGCGALLSNGLSAQRPYQVQDLGSVENLPGRSDSGPVGINEAGAVAGLNVTNGHYAAMLYHGGWKTLGTLGGNESLAGGLNDQDQVVGFAQIADGGTNGFLWSASTTNGVPNNPQMKSLGTLGGLVSEAYSINDSGQVTGYSDVVAHPNQQQHAFLISAGRMVDIGAGLSGTPNSFGYAINAAGHVAGTAYDIAYSSPHLFFFDGTNASDLGTFGGMGASGLALNNSDNVVGYLTTTTMVDRAFSYRGGTLTDLGTLGGNYSYALAINKSNVVVGGSFTDAKDSIYHAFVWQDGQMSDLNTLLDASGTGWTLVEARAINDVGQIAGVGTLAGVTHSFLLSPVGTVTNVPPQLTLFLGSGSKIVVQFTTAAGAQYVVQTNSGLTATGWANASSVLTGTGGTLDVTNGAPVASSAFYRVKVSGP